MKICTCTACRYIFRFPILPTRCPDCGKTSVRNATDTEIEKFRQEQKIIEKEIQAGLYARAG